MIERGCVKIGTSSFFTLLVYLLDVISLVGVVVAVLVFAEIFEQVFLAPDPRDFDQHLPVGLPARKSSQLVILMSFVLLL